MKRHSSLNELVRRRGETVIIMLVCFLIAGWLVQPMFESTQESLGLKKQAEITQLAQTIGYYYTDTGELPSERGNGGFCEVDVRYPGEGVCLAELLRDGYYAALPVSVDEKPYWYFRYPEYVAVGSDIPVKNILPENTCTLPSGFEFWCVKIHK